MQNHDSQPGAEHSAPIYYVGVGASAGGLEALESFFTPMPAESGMAFIVIQHLSPDYKSMMVELLSKRTAMPVRRAEEGMRVEANSVYLIPPKKNLSIFHGKLLLSESDHSRGLNLPIDVFLRSLADDQGEKAIGVISAVRLFPDSVRTVREAESGEGMRPSPLRTAVSARRLGTWFRTWEPFSWGMTEAWAAATSAMGRPPRAVIFP